MHGSRVRQKVDRLLASLGRWGELMQPWNQIFTEPCTWNMYAKLQIKVDFTEMTKKIKSTKADLASTNNDKDQKIPKYQNQFLAVWVGQSIGGRVAVTVPLIQLCMQPKLGRSKLVHMLA